MNYLKSIKSQGLKSGDFQHDLDRVNLVIGRSGRGKTARLDAIRLALNGGTLLGRASDLKSRTIDIMDLARNGHIEVQAVDDAGRKVHRRWMRGKNCTVLANEIPDTPEILLDPSQYLGLSDAKKIDYAFSLYKMDEAQSSGDAVIAELKNIRLDENTADSEAMVREIVELASGMNQDRRENNETVQEFLSILIQGLKIRLSAARAASERMTKTVQGITTLQSETIVRNPESELAATRKEWIQRKEGLTWLERQQADVKSILQRRAWLQAEILGLQDNPKAVVETKKQIEELEAEIARIESAPLVLPAEFAGINANDLEIQIASFKRSIAEYQASVPVKCPTCGGPIHNKEIEMARDAVSKLQAQFVALMNARNKATLERDGILRTKHFHLSQHRQYLDGLSAVASKRTEAEARLSELSLDGKPSLESLAVEIGKAQSTLAELEKKVSDLEKQKTAYIQAKADEARNAQALIQQQKDRLNMLVTQQAIERLEKIQAQMVESAFETILKTVNAVAGALIKEPIQYRNGEIGRWVGDSFIRYTAFSKTEQGLVDCGISLALGKDAEIKIVMLDELGRMDPESLAKFLGRMLDLSEDGTIGQFVGCLSGAPQAFPKGVKLVAV